MGLNTINISGNIAALTPVSMRVYGKSNNAAETDFLTRYKYGEEILSANWDAANGRVRVVMNTAHDLKTGDTVLLSSCSPTTYNGTGRVEYSAADVFFIYPISNKASTVGQPDVADLGSSVTVDSDIYFRRAVISGNKADGTVNSGNISIGALSSMVSTPVTVISPGDNYVIEAAPGCKLNLRDLYLTTTSANDGAVVQFH